MLNKSVTLKLWTKINTMLKVACERKYSYRYMWLIQSEQLKESKDIHFTFTSAMKHITNDQIMLSCVI